MNTHQHEALPSDTAFRVIELHSGESDDAISCTLHMADWPNPPPYEAISYAWGDAKVKGVVQVDGKELGVTRNLLIALEHLRYMDRSRYLWADAICINQSDIPERSHQVKQMLKIYQKAQAVLIFLGADDEVHHAAPSTHAIRSISAFLCKELDISVAEQAQSKGVYQEMMLRNVDRLPAPDDCDYGTEIDWESVVWFYSHPYFTRVWAIQEVQANQVRLVHTGRHKIEWNHVDLVASYILAEPRLSNVHGFTKTHCWWAATIAEMSTQPREWIATLYLATNYFSLDARDRIYGLRGLMDLGDGAGLLEPDYGKSTVEVYQDSVAAAFVDARNTDALLYIAGTETPSWVPRWDVPMLFRNPFRFGKRVPWRPSGGTEVRWNIDREANVLSLEGFFVDDVKKAVPYNQRYFSDNSIQEEDGKNQVRLFLRQALETLARIDGTLPVSLERLTAAATCISFGQDEKINIADETVSGYKFVAFLRLVLTADDFHKYVGPDAAEAAKDAEGHVFGKPVWDFDYPTSSLFVTGDGLVGCGISVANPGDRVFVALGSTYPFLLRPSGSQYLLKGYAYVHGIMHGERAAGGQTTAQIR